MSVFISFPYIDDVLFEKNIQHIETLLKVTQKEGFRLEFVKSKFAGNEFEYLGHIVGNDVRLLAFGSHRGIGITKFNYQVKYYASCRR